MTWLHLQDQPHEPQVGDEIQHIGPLGLPNGIVSKVKQVLAEDKSEDLFEVVDQFNQILIVTEAWANSWLEVDI